MPQRNLENFLDGFSFEEIKEIIFTLIEQYFPVMEDAEKQDFILKLLGKSGDDKLSSMVNRWIAVCMDEGVDPKKLGQQMVTVIDEHAALESLANPEIRTLFVDWMEELEQEILQFSKGKTKLAPEDLTKQFKISKQGADFLLVKMKQEGKIQWIRIFVRSVAI